MSSIKRLKLRNGYLHLQPNQWMILQKCKEAGSDGLWLLGRPTINSSNGKQCKQAAALFTTTSLAALDDMMVKAEIWPTCSISPPFPPLIPIWPSLSLPISVSSSLNTPNSSSAYIAPSTLHFPGSFISEFGFPLSIHLSDIRPLAPTSNCFYLLLPGLYHPFPSQLCLFQLVLLIHNAGFPQLYF